MAQITIYLPDEIENRARKAAKTKGASVSRWIAEQIVNSLQDSWPKSVVSAAGAFPNFPDVDDIRKGHGKDAARESID